MPQKRSIDSFFVSKSSPASKRPRLSGNVNDFPPSNLPPTTHSTYPVALPQLPPHIADAISEVPAEEAKPINDRPDLDLLYFQPYIAKDVAWSLFEFLRRELFFYRVTYNIKRGPTETEIKTPR